MSKAKTSPEKLHLPIENRIVFGKQLKKLRRAGLIPANIFGPEFKSLAITVSGKEFRHVYKTAGETGVIYLNVEKKEVPVLIKQVQHHPINSNIIHVDFRKIDLKQKLETSVPIKIVNESPAIYDKGGVLLTQASHVIIESLPDDIPHEVEVDVSKLTEIGNEIKIKDLPIFTTYAYKEDPEKIVLTVIEHKEESITPETAQVAPEVIGEDKEAVAEATTTKEEKEEEPGPTEKIETKGKKS